MLSFFLFMHLGRLSGGSTPPSPAAVMMLGVTVVIFAAVLSSYCFENRKRLRRLLRDSARGKSS